MYYSIQADKRKEPVKLPFPILLFSHYPFYQFSHTLFGETPILFMESYEVSLFDFAPRKIKRFGNALASVV